MNLKPHTNIPHTHTASHTHTAYTRIRIPYIHNSLEHMYIHLVTEGVTFSCYKYSHEKTTKLYIMNLLNIFFEQWNGVTHDKKLELKMHY